MAFLFIIILGEMLLTEIKTTIKKTPQNNTKYQDGFDNTYVLLRRKLLNHNILRVINVNSFKEGVYHTSSHLLLRIISYTLNLLNVLLGYEFRLRFSVRKGFI